MHLRNSFGLATLALLAGGCAADTNPTADPGPGATSGADGAFQVVVAPWEVDSDASYACYAIDVTDAEGFSVWSAPQVCTNKFSVGAGGDLSYVGICDASGTGINTVRISLTKLVADDGSDLSNWGTHPPTFTDDFVCTANADTLVRASFLVITQGTKGFLDVQVSVQQIECNAKIDCQSGFLDNPGDDLPASASGTIVVALACDAQGSDFTQIMLDDVVLTCMDMDNEPVVTTVDPSMGLGSLPGYPQGPVFGATGNAGVSTDGTSYWTLAIGVAQGWHDCHLSTRMAASDGRAMDTNNQFPIIIAENVPFGFDAAGVFSCVPNPLDGLASGLTSSWGSGDSLDFDACLNVDGTVGICL
ncbi:MAG: hypothetical protein U1F43_16825 [Myxococcota bacterium]